MSVNNLTATFTYVQTNDTELGLDLCDNLITVFWSFLKSASKLLNFGM